jgi:hypothetical protein
MAQPPPSPARTSRLTQLLDELRAHPDQDHTIAQLIELMRHAGFGALLLFLTLLSTVLPGAGIVFGLVIAGLGAQLIAGREQPWLLGFIRRRVVPARALGGVTRRLDKWSARLERWVKPRWSGLTSWPLFGLTGLAVTFLGLGLALPLPLPGSNLVFSFPLLVYAIALLEDDGMLLAIGHALAAADVTLCVVFSDVVTDAIQAAARWIGGLGA